MDMAGKYQTQQKQQMPDNLGDVLGGEEREFAVYSKRAYPVGTGLAGVGFSLFWLSISVTIGISFLGPVLVGGESHFSSNGVPVVASANNLGPLVGPAIFSGVFVLIGLVLLGGSVKTLFTKGGWFVGTKKRLIKLKGGEIQSIDWENFTGELFVRILGEKGNIVLTMRTGKMVSRKSGERFVADKIYMLGIPDVMKVEKICRERIKENDPTPNNG